jgi:hypothetical protein
VAVIEVLPGLFALAAVKAKLTAFAERLTETASCRVAFRLIGRAPELMTCAWDIPANAANNPSSGKTLPILLNLFIFSDEFVNFLATLPVQQRANLFGCPLLHVAVSFTRVITA